MYRIFDLLLHSSMPLPELEATPTGPVDIRITQRTISPRTAAGLQWQHHWREAGGEICLSLAKPGSDFYLRFPDLADFRINSVCDAVIAMPAADVPATSIRHLLIDQVLPRVVAQRGRPVLHASAVAHEGRIIAFVGESGAGKSTIAACLHQRGLQFLADDCLALEPREGEVWGIPAYTGARLWGDSPALGASATADLQQVAHYSDKWRVPLPDGSTVQPMPLRAVYVISPQYRCAGEARLQITPLRGAAGLMALVEHSFKLDVRDGPGIGRQFETLSRMVNNSLPIYQLCFPHLPEMLEDVFDEIATAAMNNAPARPFES